MALNNEQWKHLPIHLRRAIVEITTGTVPDPVIPRMARGGPLGAIRADLFRHHELPSVLADCVELNVWASKNKITVLDLHEILRQVQGLLLQHGAPELAADRPRLWAPGDPL
jgi:hypothetical protein